MKVLAVFAFLLAICMAWAETEDNHVGDPCAHHHCHLGHECDLDEEGLPVCVCTRKCLRDGVVKVCSTLNATFESECELYRQKCLCHQNSDECLDMRFKKGHLDYYGECKEIKACTGEEMEEFPKRMRNWLYLVMEELDRRQDLPPKAHEMVVEAKTQSRPWVLPVIWKFCDLDISHDRLVNYKELLPITAPLKALEHCTAPFLEGCDSDSDGKISLEEWGSCLGLDPEEVEDRCEALRG